MWKAALLSEDATIAAMTTIPSDVLCDTIDNMLYRPNDPLSCFQNESDALRSNPPQIRALFNVADKIYIIASRGRVHGCVAVEHRAEHAYIFSFCVHHLMRGDGLGSRLLDHVKSLYPRLELSVFRDPNTAVTQRVLTFYERHGFRAHRHTPDFIYMSWRSPRAQSGI